MLKWSFRGAGRRPWFTLTKLRHVGDEEKPIPSCLDTRSAMMAPPVLLQSAFCALKKTDWPKLYRFKFLVLDVLSARRVSAELQLEASPKTPKRWGRLEFIATFSIGFGNGSALTSLLPMLVR